MKRSQEILTLSTVIAMFFTSSTWAGNGPPIENRQLNCTENGECTNNQQQQSLAGNYLTDSEDAFLSEPKQANSDNGAHNNQQGSQENCMDEDCSLLELAEISEAEIATLLFMREEEKMARDVYITLYEVWQTQIFTNISQAEQRHMEQIKALMDGYELPDSALEEIGLFANSDIQALYDSLIERGSISQLEAFQVGALVEEVDIADLENAIAETENPALEKLYTNLMNGSYSHLRSFVRNIESLDNTYQVQYLPQEEVDYILNPATANPGIAINVDDSQITATNAQFKPLIKNQNGSHNNGAVFAQNDEITLATTFRPDTTHIGQNADLLTAATFTPVGDNRQSMFMRGKNGNWQQWDGDLNNVVVSQTQQKLSVNQRFEIYQGSLPAGKYQISTAYRLQNGTFILDEQPMNFSVK
ncbi:MAG: DUF2202 domain-containing protein [Thiomargarita sp.]|nr:DUF2202 domain-containing protein [Thiomargarita sp.]